MKLPRQNSAESLPFMTRAERGDRELETVVPGKLPPDEKTRFELAPGPHQRGHPEIPIRLDVESGLLPV